MPMPKVLSSSTLEFLSSLLASFNSALLFFFCFGIICTLYDLFKIWWKKQHPPANKNTAKNETTMESLTAMAGRLCHHLGWLQKTESSSQTENPCVNKNAKSGEKKNEPTLKSVSLLANRLAQDLGKLEKKGRSSQDDADNSVSQNLGKLSSEKRPVNKNEPTLKSVTLLANRLSKHLRLLDNGEQTLSQMTCVQVDKKQTTSQVNMLDSAGSTTIEQVCNIEDLMKEFDIIISTMVGLEGVKLQLRKWVNGLALYEKRKTFGLKVGTRKALHMAFLGNPGTGKTMVARTLGTILNKLGFISSDKVIEVQRTDLVAQYIGQTGPKTRTKIVEAWGGILFVDEAYRLTQPDSSRDFGIEALEEILSAMDNGDIIAIFAGYSTNMKQLISANEGFARRVTKIFNFDDYSPRDIAMILQSKINAPNKNSSIQGFKIHLDCTLEAMVQLIKEHTTEEQRKKMNAGLIDPWLISTLENMDLRLGIACSDVDTLITITMTDFEEGLKSLSSLSENKLTYEHIYI